MKLKKIFTGFVMSLSILSTAVYADTISNSAFFSGEDMCANLPGAWKGSGSITAKVADLTVKCDYTGTGMVTDTGNHTYSAFVDFYLQSGSYLCPKYETYTIPGTCDSATGVLVMKSADVDLTGKLEDNGTKASLTGTVQIIIKNKAIPATVTSMILIKQ